MDKGKILPDLMVKWLDIECFKILYSIKDCKHKYLCNFLKKA